MKFLLDTCVVSDFIKGDAHTMERIKHTTPAEIAVSTITVMEIYYGLALNLERAKAIGKIIDAFFAHVNILNFDASDAKIAGTLRASSLKKQGRPIGYYDILLAGAAVNREMIFVSSNVKEFSRIEALRLENWRGVLS